MNIKKVDTDLLIAGFCASLLMISKEILCFFGVCKIDRYLNQEKFRYTELALYVVSAFIFGWLIYRRKRSHN